MMRFLLACFFFAAIVAASPVFAQSSEDDVCAQRLLSEGKGVGGCVQVSACSGDNLTQFVLPNESLCDTEAGEVCCYSEGGLGGSSQLPASSGTDDAAPANPGRGELNDGRSYLTNPLSGRTVPVIIGNTVSWLGRAAGALFFLYLLWGGVQWMTAQGDQTKVQEAQKRIVAAIAGIAIVLLSYMIVASLITVIPQ